ncbi:hypothetical protein Zmor_027882 [Zophobas morio]|uniref:Uncharacterized protein n=1 Tax=Zophobas morio TaxID=2755281 RepID=A0AA38HRL4_9CUCU|nr:hypothetical protein Zmor_027882 [Zophobas morio]
MKLSAEDYRQNDDAEIISPDDRAQGLRSIFSEVRKRLDAASAKSKKRYDLRRRLENFVPGEFVWRRKYVLSSASKFFSQKLAPKFVGPFVIHKRVSPWTFELRDNNGQQKGVSHAKDLKPTDYEDPVAV